MKIYFAGSIRGGREDADLYEEIIDYLKEYGEVLTEHIGKKDMHKMGEKHMSDREIHDRDMDWLDESDCIVAEVTVVSLGVGYEIGRAVEKGKKILCLYRPQEGKRLSAMISGSQEVTNAEYRTLDEAKDVIMQFLS